MQRTTASPVRQSPDIPEQIGQGLDFEVGLNMADTSLGEQTAHMADRTLPSPV